jgi:hypothetical protein
VTDDRRMTAMLVYFPALMCGATCLGAMLFRPKAHCVRKHH